MFKGFASHLLIFFFYTVRMCNERIKFEAVSKMPKMVWRIVGVFVPQASQPGGMGAL